MSRWGRAQDAVTNLLGGFEISMDGKRQKGLLEDKLTWTEIHALIEPILEAVAPIFEEEAKNALVLADGSLTWCRARHGSEGEGDEALDDAITAVCAITRRKPR